MDIFAYHFGEHVIPRLTAMAMPLAMQVALGEIEFGEAHNELRIYAARHGASFLGAKRMDELNDWISSELLHAVVKAEETMTSLEMREAADPARYYDQLANACSDPDAMRWVFAAISPEYRKHLKAEPVGAQ